MFSNTSLSLLQLSLLYDASVLAQSTETREAGPAPTQYITVQGGYIPTAPSPLPATFSQPYAVFSTAIVSPSGSSASGSGYAFGSSPPCFAYCQMDASQNIPPTCGSLVASQCTCDPAVVSALQKCLQANCEAAQLPDAETLLLQRCSNAAQIVSSGAQSVSVASVEASQVLPPALAGTPSQSAQTSSAPVSDSASASPTASASVADPNQLNPTFSPDTARGNAARGLHADAPAVVAVLLAGLSVKALAEVLLAEVLL